MLEKKGRAPAREPGAILILRCAFFETLATSYSLAASAHHTTPLRRTCNLFDHLGPAKMVVQPCNAIDDFSQFLHSSLRDGEEWTLGKMAL